MGSETYLCLARLPKCQPAPALRSPVFVGGKWPQISFQDGTLSARCRLQVQNRFLNIRCKQQQAHDLRQSRPRYATLFWADNAFDHKDWAWAAYSYAQLLNLEKEKQFIGITQLSRYRAAFCFLELAKSFECQGINSKRAAAFASAEQALKNAIVLHDQFLEHDNAAVVLYNNACAAAQWARVLVHKELVLTGKSTNSDLHKEVLGPDNADRVYAEVWSGIKKEKKKEEEGVTDRKKQPIGKVWRDLCPRAIPEVERIGDEAMDSLKQLSARAQGGKISEESSSDVRFWIDYAHTDSDLVLLQWDEDYREKFDRWENRFRKKSSAEFKKFTAQIDTQILLEEVEAFFDAVQFRKRSE